MNDNTLISLRGIRVDYDDEPVLKGIDLDIMDKEFITFLGCKMRRSPAFTK